jgi:hypothetical protein
VDPNFLALACRTSEELKGKAAQGKMLNDRKQALERYITEAKVAKDNAHAGGAFEQKTAVFLQEKADANAILYEIYQGKAGAEREKAFFEASKRAWSKGVPDVIKKLEDRIKGQFALGDQVVSQTWNLLT